MGPTEYAQPGIPNKELNKRLYLDIVMDRDRRLTGYLRGQTDKPDAPLGFEVNNPWRVSNVSVLVSDNAYECKIGGGPDNLNLEPCVYNLITTPSLLSFSSVTCLRIPYPSTYLNSFLKTSFNTCTLSPSILQSLNTSDSPFVVLLTSPPNHPSC